MAAQKWYDNGKIFNNDNSGEFVNQRHKFAWIVVINFDFTIFFMLLFLHGPHLFLQFGCFCVDMYILQHIFTVKQMHEQSKQVHAYVIVF